MAACVGDTIVCSPFAVVGSIGVIQEMPNVYERLKREGVEFHQVTAGQYKRVLSPTKEVTPEDLQKSKDDIEEVWTLFKDFVSEQRPTLDMDTVATGEVWYGKRAVEVGLCDAVQAADDVLIEFIDRGYDVYRVKYEEPIPDFWEQLTGKATASSTTESGLGSSLLRWCLQKIVALLQAELGNMAGIDNHHLQHRPLLV
jgi:ClpP class serine protease